MTMRNGTHVIDAVGIGRRLLESAGVTAGQRVLDVGCGDGGLSFEASSIVGPAGYVIGVDPDAGRLDAARSRASAAGLTNVQFRRAAVDDVALPLPVDALIGRDVLMLHADPPGALRRLRPLVRAGGVISFQETAGSAAEALRAVFVAAGLPGVQTRAVGPHVAAWVSLSRRR
jgi:ubiquinone/menaquinone biosynthesis C-methylase UbiE